MTPEQKEVHERLSAHLVKHEHVRAPEEKPSKHAHGKHSKAKRAVIVDGVRYESLSAASRATGISRQLIYWRIHNSKSASYAD